MTRTLLAPSVAVIVVLFGGFVTSASDAAPTAGAELRLTGASIDGRVHVRYTNNPWWKSCAHPACSWRDVSTDHEITLVAEDGATSRFHGWDGACAASGSSRTCTIRATAPVTYVIARFSPWRLWLPAFGNGKITVEPLSSTSAGRSCGSGCVDYPDGAVLRLRAVADSARYMMVAWGGDCASVSAGSRCRLTLRSNSVVSATFIERPPEDCPVGKACGPVGTTIPFDVVVVGRGEVVGPRVGDRPPQTCKPSGSYTPSGVTRCTFHGLLDRQVVLKAFSRDKRPFVRWDGPCSGTGACKFSNRRYRSGTPTITATFG